MGPFLASAARRLNEPAVRTAEPGADWRELAARAAPGPTDQFPLAIDDAAPLAFATRALAALVAGRHIQLRAPGWTAAERAAAETIRTAAPVGPPPAGTPRILVATGGSGGTLRFATHTPDTLAAAALALQAVLGGGPLNSLCLLPLHHVGGFQQLVRALVTGGDCVLGDWHAVAAGRRPALPPAPGGWMLPLVPAQLARLLDAPEALAWLRGFTSILLGGAPAGPALLARARAERLPLALAYGASEFGAALALQPPAEFLAGEVGLRPMPHATVRVVDPLTGGPVPVGELGRIEVTASSLFLGYWPEGRPAGPWRTEDLGTLDTAGRLLVHGRADAAINTGGEKVHPAEVEHALRATGAFSELVVLGTPDARWGECVSAAFPATDRPDLPAVERALRATLAPHKLPRRWLPLPDWPRTAQGKTDRAAVRRCSLAAAETDQASGQNSSGCS